MKGTWREIDTVNRKLKRDSKGWCEHPSSFWMPIRLVSSLLELYVPLYTAFVSQVNEQLVGAEPPDYQVFEVDAMPMYSDTNASRTSVDNQSMSVNGSHSSSFTFGATWSHLVSNLETGVDIYVRVSAQGDGVGYGTATEAGNNPVAPRGVPGQLTSVEISRVNDVTLAVNVGQNAEANGADIDRYHIEWDTSPLFTNVPRGNLSLAPDYHIQAVRVNAWQRGWTSDSAFSLSLFDFGGAYTVRLGGLDSNGLPTFVSIAEGTNLMNRTTPNITEGFGDAPLYKHVPRGGFVAVGGQSFRVCLNGDSAYDSNTLTLCSVDNAYEPAYFVGAATKYDNTLTRVPAYVLDTAIGSAFRLAEGDTVLRTYDGPDSNVTINDLTSDLARGDHVRLGHPELGRVFTVCADDGTSSAEVDFNSTSLPLCASDDPTQRVSVLEGDILSATYEIQEFGVWVNTSSATSNDTGNLGYRIVFGDETSSQTDAGGSAGCLLFSATAAQVRIPYSNHPGCLLSLWSV